MKSALDPTHDNAFRLATVQHIFVELFTKAFEPIQTVVSLLLEPGVTIGPMELLDLSPNTKLKLQNDFGHPTPDKFLETELQMYSFSPEIEAPSFLAEMKVPKGTVAMSMSYSMTFDMAIADLSEMTEEFSLPSMRATTALTADGTHWSFLTPGDCDYVKTQEIWNPIPLQMGQVFNRSR
jgi:hypothetical protein